MRSFFFLCLAMTLTAVGCDCSSTDDTCTSTDDCAAGEMCIDSMCMPPDDSGTADSSMDTSTTDTGSCPATRACASDVCCGEAEECVDGFLCLPICDNTRCGDNGMLCCEAGDICLDGIVCAADCAATQALCGADNDVCCPTGDVCLDDVCATPGELCDDDFDCRDAALYCEPTIGRCLATPGDPACEVRPEFDRIELVEEWHFDEVDSGGTIYNQVLSAPVVGDVSGDGIPDVVVPVYSGTNWNDPVIVGLSGDDGTLLFTIPRASGLSPESEGIALANFEPSDAALELVYRLDAGGLRMMDGDGVTELARRSDSNERGTVEVADFNHDGVPDVVLGCRVYDGLDISDPARDIIAGGTCVAGGWEAPVVADLDGDSEYELTNGRVALNHDGSTLWNLGFGGNVAVADLDADGSPEVISIASGQVRVLAGATGATLIGPGGAWHDGTFTIPGGGTGGPPTVADFDGDGLPEISTAGQGFYAVFDPDCFATPARMGGDACATTNFLRWQAPTQDLSSSVTGSSVFDFQGDGVAEVIYNDECFLHIYDGRDGTDILMEPTPNSSRTAYEYPIVVDVDADGNSEIVVVANNDQAVGRDNCPAAYSTALGVPVASLPAEYARGTNGVFVYGDARDRWVPTRPIWNQYSYHVSNVSSSGDIPPTEVDNWTTPGLNNYRQNVQGTGIFNAPNLTATLDAAGMCSAGSILLSAVVRNEGTRGVPAGITVEFWRTDVMPPTLVGSSNTISPLLPGGSERITVTVADVPVDIDLDYEVRIDPATPPDPGDAIECIEDDNVATATDTCPGLM